MPLQLFTSRQQIKNKSASTTSQDADDLQVKRWLDVYVKNSISVVKHLD